jgi:hypothetical protein
MRDRTWRPLLLTLPALPLAAATWNVDTVAGIDTAYAAAVAGDEIVIAAGTYQLDHTINLNTSGVTIRGATGNRDDVVLVGGGMNTHGVDEGISIAANDLTVRDLTVQDFYYNGIHCRAEDNADRYHIDNVKTVNIGERHIKGSRGPDGIADVSEDCIIEHVLMVQTIERSGHPDTDPDYIGGMDMMCTRRLIVRDCVAQGIHGQNDGGNAAIFLWNGVEDATVERNRVVGCAKGIAFGNPAAPGTQLATGRWHAIGGVIRNNFVQRGAWTTANNIGIELCSTKDVQVVDNTVYSDDATFFRTISISDCEVGVGLTTGDVLSGNLIRGQLKDFTDGSGWSQTGDLIDGTGATVLALWFLDPANGDYHLTASATGAIGHGTPSSAAPTDIDLDVRVSPGDIGADQFGTGGTATAGGTTTGGATSGGSATSGTVGGGTGGVLSGGTGGSNGGCGIGSLFGLIGAVLWCRR